MRLKFHLQNEELKTRDQDLPFSKCIVSPTRVIAASFRSEGLLGVQKVSSPNTFIFQIFKRTKECVLFSFLLLDDAKHIIQIQAMLTCMYLS